MSNRVVARYKDGRVIKGTSLDVDPSRTNCHIVPPGGGRSARVELADLKALFFVRTLDGDPAFKEDLKPDPEDPRTRGSFIVALRFSDGEEMVGITIRYPPNRPYFFVVPVDADSNNIRILVNRAAVVSMEQRGVTQAPDASGT
jgi:hypothetical protein